MNREGDDAGDVEGDFEKWTGDLFGVIEVRMRSRDNARSLNNAAAEARILAGSRSSCQGLSRIAVCQAHLRFARLLRLSPVHRS